MAYNDIFMIDNSGKIRNYSQSSILDITNKAGASRFISNFMEVYGGTFSANGAAIDTNGLFFPMQKADPDPTGVEGAIYYNTTSNTFRWYDGSNWASLGGGGTNFWKNSGYPSYIMSPDTTSISFTKVSPSTDKAQGLGQIETRWAGCWAKTGTFGDAACRVGICSLYEDLSTTEVMISAEGTQSNINLDLQAKGTGIISMEGFGLKIDKTIKANGSVGSAGQVLTSNGSSPAYWAAAGGGYWSKSGAMLSPQTANDCIYTTITSGLCAIEGYNNGNGTAGDCHGIYGFANGISGTSRGVVGEAEGAGTSNYGVHGVASGATSNTGVYGLGTTYGLYGTTSTAGGYGVGGFSLATSGTKVGIYGKGSGAGNYNHGVYGYATGGTWNYGTYGKVDGNTAGSSKVALYGEASGTGTVNYGVYASASGATANYAGYFSGAVYISGALSITSTALVTNLNADAVDGRHIIGAGYADISCSSSGKYDASIYWNLSSTPSYVVITGVDTNDGRFSNMELYGKKPFTQSYLYVRINCTVSSSTTCRVYYLAYS